MRRQLFIFILIFILLLAGAWYIYLSETSTIYTVATYWVICILFLVGIGNYLIYRWLNHLIPWENDSLKRILYQLLLSGVYTLICANLSYYLFKSNLTELPPDAQQITLLNVYAIFIIIPVFSIFFGIYFLTKWKKATLEMEDAKKEAIRSELLALKNHLDPHFLFNNLNILSSLIDTENESAQSFLEKFAEVYRYVLKNKDSEVIQLNQELEFLESYIYLINKRFEHQLEFKLNIEEQALEKFIPTLAIQMLVENALKHNKYSRQKKLSIRIYTENHLLVISNNYNPISSLAYEKKQGSGLINIEKRYVLLFDKKPEVKIENNQFIVELPLLNKE